MVEYAGRLYVSDFFDFLAFALISCDCFERPTTTILPHVSIVVACRRSSDVLLVVVHAKDVENVA